MQMFRHEERALVGGWSHGGESSGSCARVGVTIREGGLADYHLDCTDWEMGAVECDETAAI